MTFRHLSQGHERGVSVSIFRAYLFYRSPYLGRFLVNVGPSGRLRFFILYELGSSARSICTYYFRDAGLFGVGNSQVRFRYSLYVLVC